MTTEVTPAPAGDATRLQYLLARALEAMDSAVCITDRTSRIVWVNQAFRQLSGYSQEELIGATPRLLKSGKHGSSFYRALWQTILDGRVWRGEVVERNKNGTFYAVDQVITPLHDEQGQLTHFIAVQNDITQRKEEGDRERFLAYHDALTGLPNRTMFFAVLEQAICHARDQHQSFALLYLDLDKFKPINDRFGHDLGDVLLIAVARRLKAAVRTEDLVVRLGGDEFAIIVTNIPHAKMVSTMARKLIRSVARPFHLEGREVSASASIGIAIFPFDADNAEQLLRNADMAMYRAKVLGPGRQRFHRRPA